MTLSPLAAALATELERTGTARVSREVLERAAVAADSSMGFSHDRRDRLYMALNELVATGLITLPKGKQSFEHRPSPPLPKWVRVSAVTSRPKPAAANRLWRTELAGAGDLSRNSADRELLDTVNEFLRDGGAARPMVPSRERSLQLFGDEKRLDALRRHRFFTTGALTLELLRCYDIPLPFPSVYVADPQSAPATAPLLIAENHHTYVSLIGAARRAVALGHPPFHVGWGSGNAFPQSVESAALLLPQVDRIYYFGDLDEGGLATANAVNVRMRGSSSPVLPATGLYSLLLENGVPRAVSPVEPERANRLAQWLGPELGSSVAELLADGTALRQEAVGTELLLERGFPMLEELPSPGSETTDQTAST